MLEPRFRALLLTGEWGWSRWRPVSHVRLEQHVFVHENPAGESPDFVWSFEQYFASLEEIAKEPMDLSKPLWQMHLFPKFKTDQGDCTSLLLIRVHHCLGDGQGLLCLLVKACSQEGSLENMITALPKPKRTLEEKSFSIFSVVAEAIRNVFQILGPKDRHSFLRIQSNEPIRVFSMKAIYPALDLGRIKRLSAQYEESINDLFLSGLSKAFSALSTSSEGSDMLTYNWVNLRRSDMSLNNQLGLLIVKIPLVHESENLKDLACMIRKQTNPARVKTGALVSYALAVLASWLPVCWCRFVLREWASRPAVASIETLASSLIF
jgi:NRPS condensation-like uncharacterized protein